MPCTPGRFPGGSSFLSFYGPVSIQGFLFLLLCELLVAIEYSANLHSSFMKLFMLLHV